MRHTKFASISVTVVVVLLMYSSAWVAAEGPPVASFPEWIPFNDPYASPEGVAVDKVGNVYTSVAVGVDPATQSDEIWRFSPTGEKSTLVTFPSTGSLGLAVDAIGNVYVAKIGQDAGVYVVDRDGYAVRLPGTEQINYPNGLALDQQGNLYITDTYSLDSNGCDGLYGQGGIYRFPKGGTSAELWLRHPLLTGGFMGGCVGVMGVPVGANGIQFYHGNLYVINQDKGTIVQVPVRPDGTPGTPDVWATIQPVPESLFTSMEIPALGDGLTIDVHGNIYVAVVSVSAIVRINANDMSQETIAVFPYALLDFPASLAFGTGKGGRTSIFITNLGWLGPFFGIPSAPGPGLIKFDVGVPGLPLP
jgi:sugar lactone lactonase YvrE